MNLDSILAQLGAVRKETVYLSITPGVGLELIQIDISAKTVKNYAYRPLEYNESLREITSISAFKAAVSELFEELKISPKSNVILNVPLVLIGTKELPLLLGDDAVTEALTSEVEQSYIFKRYEPMVSWYDASDGQGGETRKLFYSAIQSNLVEELKTAITELGANLVGIETSLTSIIKALSFCGHLDEQIKDGISWNLMLINQTGYSICSMVGKNLVEFYEEPLAIKSFDGDEIYNAINASAQIALMSYPANYLCIVSETDLVSAEVLASRLTTDGVVSFVENNKFKKEDFIPVGLDVLEDVANKISLEIIGIAVSNAVNLPIKFNFLGSAQTGGNDGEDPDELVHVVLGDYEFDITPNIAKVYSMIIIAPFLLLALIAFIAMPLVAKSKQTQLDKVTAKITSTQTEIKNLEEEQNKFKGFDINDEIKKVLVNNRSKLMTYIALGESVPAKLWLTYFITKDDGKIDIKGESGSVEDVYTFYRNLKDSLINNQLKLYKLELESDSIDDQVLPNPNLPTSYEFEITNMSADELEPKVVEEKKEPENPENPVNSEGQNKDKGQLLNKPLLNFGKDTQ